MVVIDPFLPGCIGFEDLMYITQLQTFNFVFIVTVYHIYFLYLEPSKVEAGESIT